MFFKLGRRFLACSILVGERPLATADLPLRCVWYSTSSIVMPAVAKGDDGGEARYRSAAWRLIGAGLRRGGFEFLGFDGVDDPLLLPDLVFSERRNSRRPANPDFFDGWASAEAVLGDGYDGEGKMYVASGDGVWCIGGTRERGGVGIGGGRMVETGTAGMDMCLALRVVIVDACRCSTDGTTDSLASTGVRSMVRRTSSWRLDRSCLPVDARPNSGRGDA